jgi:hypothetical protein
MACSPDREPIAPDLKPGGAAALAVSPTALKFAIPPRQKAVLTVTAQGQGVITASSSAVGCATVSPSSASAAKTAGSMGYTATFTVTPVDVGSCTITVSDKKGHQAQAPVTVRASQVDMPGVTVAAGRNHSCALASTGAAY